MGKPGDYKKLSRAELLELLIEETERNERLEKDLAEARERLSSREVEINEAGSLAEAVLRLNGVFKAASEACAQYEDNIKRLNDKQTAINSEREAKSIMQAQKIIEDAEASAKRIEQTATERCIRIVELACGDVSAFRDKICEL